MPKDQSFSETRLKVENLTCGSCVARAEAALAAQPGVVSATVNLATKRADITSEGPLDMPALEQAMTHAGYPVHAETSAQITRLSVENLTCGSCVARAETALLRIPGVEKAHVNLATHSAEIESGGPLDLHAVQSHMAAAGYPVMPVAEGGDPDDDAASEIAALWRSFLLAGVLTLPVFILEMGSHLIPPFHHWVMANIGTFPSHFTQFVLTTLILAGPGRIFFRHGVPALMRGAPEMNSLVVLGTFAAWAFSTVVTFAPGLVPETSRFVYFEAAAVIVTLILLGRYLEVRARGQAGSAIRQLMGLRPETATRANGEPVAVAAVVSGDELRLFPGERVAVDGVVIDGESYIDEAMITGEPVPSAKAVGDTVTGGTLNTTGSLVYRATHVGADTVLAQIVRMVEDAQATRLPIQSLINKVTGVFVPIVLVIAITAAGAWFLFGPDPVKALVIGVSVLIIACPCAMGLATPVSIMAGTGRAAELGVLFRKGDALQSLGRVDLVAFDKTGTLTLGAPAVTRIAPVAGSEEVLLALAAAVEQNSEHPLGQAVVAEAKARELTLPEVSGFQSVTGVGVTARDGAAVIRIGTEAMMAEAGIDEELSGHGSETLIHVARDGDYLGAIALADPVKEDAAQTIATLKAQGKRVALLSGDARGPVDDVAQRLGIDESFARLSPEEKLARVETWQAEGLKVAFVGDGINDAPVLATADVGVALGSGTDVAMEAADVVLISGAPSGVATASEVSRRTMRNIVQNLVWAFGYNVALIPVAAGLLALFGGPFLSPILAAGAMAASSVLVVMNALRLRRMEAA
ncbi:copper-translocating P-type ATPase [Boseongicola sp. H5]|uniref:heavy metal translocating P-type ATPase n=1 Tax=Boseongicola sp. H5 TaxID=2763261 RepID=UPI001D0B8CF6|nr:copper-translocating P-type ATPase [Boseongicola sp. H5]